LQWAAATAWRRARRCRMAPPASGRRPRLCPLPLMLGGAGGCCLCAAGRPAPLRPLQALLSDQAPAKPAPPPPRSPPPPLHLPTHPLPPPATPCQHRRSFKGYEEVFVPPRPGQPPPAEGELVLVESMEEWAQLAFQVGRPGGRGACVCVRVHVCNSCGVVGRVHQAGGSLARRLDPLTHRHQPAPPPAPAPNPSTNALNPPRPPPTHPSAGLQDPEPHPVPHLPHCLPQQREPAGVCTHRRRQDQHRHDCRAARDWCQHQVGRLGWGEGKGGGRGQGGASAVLAAAGTQLRCCLLRVRGLRWLQQPFLGSHTLQRPQALPPTHPPTRQVRRHPEGGVQDRVRGTHEGAGRRGDGQLWQAADGAGPGGARADRWGPPLGGQARHAAGACAIRAAAQLTEGGGEGAGPLGPSAWAGPACLGWPEPHSSAPARAPAELLRWCRAPALVRLPHRAPHTPQATCSSPRRRWQPPR
jgi:hypothetical protein